MKRKLALMKIAVVAIIFCFAACKKQASNDIAPPASKKQTTTAIKAEEMFAGQTGQVQTGKYYGQPLNYMLINGYKIFEGDIVLTQNAATPSLVVDGTGRSVTSFRWPNNTIVYSFDASMTTDLLNMANAAIANWTANTNVKFLQRTNQTDYVLFLNDGSGPSSSVGKIGGQQIMHLNPLVSTGNIIHEIGHNAGLWHEQSRADRNTYINILTANIINGYQNNFQTYTQQGQDGFDYPGGLDFGSVMMYPSDAFSANGQPTITKKDGSTFTAQRNGLSALDIQTINFMYPAPPIVKYTTPVVLLTGATITPILPTNTGGAPASYSISPALPAGLTFSTSSGTITGNPSAISAATTYTVTATNGAGSYPTTINITVKAPAVTINGQQGYYWTQTGSGSGTIKAAPGTLVGLIVAAFGPGNSVNFSISGALLNGSLSNVTVNNNDISYTFTMPASGSVNWSATYTTPSGGGNGNLVPYVASNPIPPTVNINGGTSYKWTQAGPANGTISAPAGRLVNMTFNLEGPISVTNFTLTGANFTGGTNVVSVSNNYVTKTFTMPASGTVTWTGTFSSNPGNGEIDVN